MTTKTKYTPQKYEVILSPYHRLSQHTLTNSYNYTIKKQSPFDVDVENSNIQNTIDDLQFYKARCMDLERQLNLRTTREQCISISLFTFSLLEFQDQSIKETQDYEKFAKIVHQKKTEADLWKKKYENQLSQLIQIKANYELEIRQQSSDIQKLSNKLDEMQYDKQKEIMDNKVQIETHNQHILQGIKKSQSESNQCLEQQLKQLRDELNDKNSEIYELNSKLLRTKQDGEEENKRILKENEQLRQKVSEIEIARQREIEELTTNLNIYQEEQLKNLKMSQFSQNNIIESEVSKLRGLLDIKNNEIQTLIIQNQKMKALYDEDAEQQKHELNLVKQRLFDQERVTRRRLEEQQLDLQNIHHQDIEQIKTEHERWMGQMEQEIENLKESNSKKDYEIQLQQSENEQNKAYLEDQMRGLEQEIEEEKRKIKQLEREKRNEIEELQKQYEKRQSFLSEQCEQLKGQIRFLNDEIQRLKDGISQKSKEFEQQSYQLHQLKKEQEEDIKRLRNDCESLREELVQEEQQKELEINEMKEHTEQVENDYKERIRKMEIQQERDLNEIRKLKDHLEIKSQEIDNLLVSRNQMEREIRRKGDEIEELEGQIINLERIKGQQLDEMKIRMENSYRYEMSNIKNDLNGQIIRLQDENRKIKQFQIEQSKQESCYMKSRIISNRQI